MVRVGRIELPPTAWEAAVLPLNYTRALNGENRIPYRNCTPFQYFISLTAHKILEEGLAEWVPSHSSPAHCLGSSSSTTKLYSRDEVHKVKSL